MSPPVLADTPPVTPIPTEGPGGSWGGVKHPYLGGRGMAAARLTPQEVPAAPSVPCSPVSHFCSPQHPPATRARAGGERHRPAWRATTDRLFSPSLPLLLTTAGRTMSESSAKSSQPLASKGEKDVSEKRGRGRPRKKPQVCRVPWEEGPGGGAPQWAAPPAVMPWGAGHPQALGQQETPPLTPRQHPPGRGWGWPRCSPHYLPLGSTSRVLPGSKSLLGVFTAPPALQHPRAPPCPEKGSGPPLAPPQAAAEPAFADRLIKTPLAKAAQRDKMLPVPL